MVAAIVNAEILAPCAARRRHHVPTCTATTEVVQRAETPRQVVRVIVVGIHSSNQANPAGVRRQSRQQGERLELVTHRIAPPIRTQLGRPADKSAMKKASNLAASASRTALIYQFKSGRPLSVNWGAARRKYGDRSVGRKRSTPVGAFCYSWCSYQPTNALDFSNSPVRFHCSSSAPGV